MMFRSSFGGEEPLQGTYALYFSLSHCYWENAVITINANCCEYLSLILSFMWQASMNMIGWNLLTRLFCKHHKANIQYAGDPLVQGLLWLTPTQWKGRTWTLGLTMSAHVHNPTTSDTVVSDHHESSRVLITPICVAYQTFAHTPCVA